MSKHSDRERRAANKRPPPPDFALPQLTTMQQITADTIASIDRRIELLAEERDAWTEDCKHIWIPRTDKKGNPYTWCTWLKDWEIISHAFCAVCGESSNRWYCPVNPEHVCDYDDIEDPAWDNCIHCHQPDERK